ncbi:hypothetical protein SUGI_1381010 [Cryptomeria japonica]|uniref:Fungal lipase-type domain-containing protein n=1 Tax=Cryptomeria japonica TaxID=3369 RepID=A0AAD3NQR9_CRYJA|nr:GDSL esterase/lipase At4g10955-like [Cryptomeria japonica]XP_059071093.1 GDSL esterase/lipase At4g10955-like [Cryptomeria japonica]GLJ56953.1 hypothetical protein SUGI_1276210 [Cryptomeria japonica]GLJ57834.1 hypothetical protein SUGI_1381010 [Cryptomeria japonica]
MANKNGIDVTEFAHFANPDWEDPVHRRCIAASLVNVVYLLETNENQANELCCLLQFEVKETVIDDNDNSIYGVVFQWHGTTNAGPGGPPSKVVAFRGTLLRPKNISHDLVEDMKVAIRHYDSISRVEKGLQYLRKSLHNNGYNNIWLAGHSLGAAIALGTAMNLMKEERHNLEAHLFNPPFICPTVPQLKVFEMGGNFSVLRDNQRSLELYAKFVGISDWVPNIYVNQKDPICQTYVHYFEVLMGIYRHKSHLLYESMKYLFSFDLVKKKSPWHLVPSATVIVATKHFFHNHHTIRQWWLKDLRINSIEYIPPDEVIQSIKYNLPVETV